MGDWRKSEDFLKKQSTCDEDGRLFLLVPYFVDDYFICHSTCNILVGFRDSYRHREVNSFQFPHEDIGHGGGDSPELGIWEVS